MPIKKKCLNFNVHNNMFYILTFVLAFVMVALLFVHPVEVRAEDLSVGYPVNSTQNSTSLGATTKDYSQVSLFKVTTFTIHYESVNSTTNKVHKHTLTYKFRSLGGDFETAPIYLYKTAYPSGYYGVYKQVRAFSEQPFEVICLDFDTDGLAIYDRTSTYTVLGGSTGIYGGACLDFPGDSSNDYFKSSSSWWATLGFVYDYLGGTALETKDHNISGNELIGVIKSGLKTDLGFSSDSATYSDELGSLMGVSSDVLFVTGGNNQTVDSAYLLRWKGKTSTDFNLNGMDGYKKIEVQTRVELKGYYYSGVGANGDKLEMVHNIGSWFDYPNVIAAEKKVRIATSEMENNLPSFFDEYKNINNLHGKNYDIRFYLRPVALTDDGWVYGDWVRYTINEVSGTGYVTGESTGDVTGGDFNPDTGEFEPDPNSPSNGTSDVGTGSGSSLDDAEDDATTSGGGSSSGGLTDLKSFFEMVGQIPSLIADILSFLPAWCLGFIAFGFAVFVALMIVKAVRG